MPPVPSPATAALTRELADRFLDAFDATLRGK